MKPFLFPVAGNEKGLLFPPRIHGGWVGKVISDSIIYFFKMESPTEEEEMKKEWKKK